MEITPGISPTQANDIHATDSVNNQITGKDPVQEGTSGVADQVDLSDAGKMLSTAMRLTINGNPEAQAFMESLQNDMLRGAIDQERLLKKAPEILIETMEERGIEFKAALQAIDDYTANIPPSTETSFQENVENGEAGGTLKNLKTSAAA